MNELALVTLAECPPGPFIFEGTLGFKTEYGMTIGTEVTHWPDAYCMASGECFWGGAPNHEARAALLVQPVDLEPASVNVVARGTDGEIIWSRYLPTQKVEMEDDGSFTVIVPDHASPILSSLLDPNGVYPPIRNSIDDDDRRAAIDTLLKWRADNPLYDGDDARAIHYRKRLYDLDTAILALALTQPVPQPA